MHSRILTSVMIGLSMTALSGVAIAQEHASPQEVVAKVREAAAELSKGGDVKQFNDEKGPWVFKDTYVWIEDCEKHLQVTHPLRPDLVGDDFRSIKDSRGKKVFPATFCEDVKQPSGTWIEYRWPKPGEKKDSRKVTYCTSASGTPYVTCAGFYGEKETLAELKKVSAGK